MIHMGNSKQKEKKKKKQTINILNDSQTWQENENFKWQ